MIYFDIFLLWDGGKIAHEMYPVEQKRIYDLTAGKFMES